MRIRSLRKAWRSLRDPAKDDVGVSRSALPALLHWICGWRPISKFVYQGGLWKQVSNRRSVTTRFRRMQGRSSQVSAKPYQLDFNEDVTSTPISDPWVLPRSSSVCSFDSDHIDTNLTEMARRLLSLVAAERTRRKLKPKLDLLKADVKSTQKSIDLALANLRHMSRRRARMGLLRQNSRYPDETAEIDAKNRKAIEVYTERKYILAAEILMLGNRLKAAVDVQEELEPGLFRAASGFHRNMRDYHDEDLMTREERHWLRLVADLGRSPLLRAGPIGVAQPTPTSLVLRPDQESEVTLNHRYEARLRWENFRETMEEFYTHMEAMLVRSGDLSFEELAAPVEVEPEGPVTMEKMGLSDQLNEAYERLATADEQLRNQKHAYASRRELFVLAYEDNHGYVKETASGQYPEFVFDRSWIRTTYKNNDNIRKAEADVRELQNRALSSKVFVEEYDLLGVLDHPDDGFTESEGSQGRREHVIRKASKFPVTLQWLVNTDLRRDVYTRKPQPRDSSDFKANSDARHPISCIDAPYIRYDRELITRWEAEMAVTRQEVAAVMSAMS